MSGAPSGGSSRYLPASAGPMPRVADKNWDRKEPSPAPRTGGRQAGRGGGWVAGMAAATLDHSLGSALWHGGEGGGGESRGGGRQQQTMQSRPVVVVERKVANKCTAREHQVVVLGLHLAAKCEWHCLRASHRGLAPLSSRRHGHMVRSHATLNGNAPLHTRSLQCDHATLATHIHDACSHLQVYFKQVHTGGSHAAAGASQVQARTA